MNDSEIGGRIEELLRVSITGARDVRAEEVERVFGGNARRAWASTVRWTDQSGARRSESVIMLSRTSGSQVDADPEWEFGVLSALEHSATRAPRAFALDADGSIVGAPSILLERMPGRADPLAFLRSEDREGGRKLTLDLARAAAELHSADWEEVGLGEILASGPPDRSPLTQIESWEAQFLTHRMEPHPALAYAFAWLRANLPEPARISVVHGDFRPGNFLYQSNTVVALLDWEMAHLGDPVEDLAWAYRALWSPERFVDLEEFVRSYEEFGGPKVTEHALRFYRVFAEAKFATISLRASRSFADGVSGNLRLADRAATVTASMKRCLAWIADSGKGSAWC
ncbi:MULTISPECIES: phosphotransferase family protein [Rhodococcus]|uniref:phosphotransferase family protein n=1 Tax=Rhodococcus TaxID=1827 RepID=UPI00193BAD84|nr:MULTISPECIES: phosphotransferase family protein [Rhodococcus]QRI79196.1 phosphotransferase family protein [Rhodococcus aetherivorans]QSE62493.1 phosphotransferase family protein [Rhodococcus sp. PSBB066]